jgi:hypothetical protein
LEENILKNSLASIALPQLDELIANYEGLKKQTQYDDFSDLNTEKAREFVTAAMSAIHRVAGPDSQYTIQSQATIKEIPFYQVALMVQHLGGMLKALRHAVASGYLASIQETIHANIFADFLEMAEYLLGEGFKDPSAVLIGGVLEEHLRKLCDKNTISTNVTDSKGVSRPKKAETMNTDLTSQNVYSKLDQTNVTAWLALRNKAAHGHYGEYTSQQVELLLQLIRDFITRNPA